MWLRKDDNFATDPVLLNACRTRADKTKALGLLLELELYCASHVTDGFLPELIFNDVVRGKRWRELMTDPPGGGIALVHRRGDECECLKDRVWPETAADLFLHHYLKSNPSREETDVARAKAAELRDPELRSVVRKRDHDRCRYCGVRVRWSDRRSSVGGVLDHVDPSTASGAWNLVVACRGCNSRKGNRTPAAAGMTLLVPPGVPVTPEFTYDDPQVGSGGDLHPTNGLDADATTGPPVRDGTGRVTDPDRVQTSGGAGNGVPAPPGLAGDAGPAGDRPTTGPPSTVRTSRHPDPHRRSAITAPDPLDHAGLPGPDDVDNADAELWLAGPPEADAYT